jgi:hypothetical protein
MWRDRVDVPSECTIVEATEWIGQSVGQKKSVAGGSQESKGNTQKETRKESQRPVGNP